MTQGSQKNLERKKRVLSKIKSEKCQFGSGREWDLGCVGVISLMRITDSERPKLGTRKRKKKKEIEKEKEKRKKKKK